MRQRVRGMRVASLAGAPYQCVELFRELFIPYERAVTGQNQVGIVDIDLVLHPIEISLRLADPKSGKGAEQLWLASFVAVQCLRTAEGVDDDPCDSLLTQYPNPYLASFQTIGLNDGHVVW